MGLSGIEDPKILEWAAQEGRILLTHDVRTITHFAYARVKLGLPMPGILEVPRWLPVGQIIEEIALFALVSLENEYEGQVKYLPLTS